MDDQIASAKAYHWATKYNRHRITPRALDFDHYPVPVKSYDFKHKINLIKNLSSLDQTASILVDFDDETVSGFLSLDNTKEVPLVCVTVGRDDQMPGHQIDAGVALTGPRAKQKNVQFSGTAYPLLQKIYNLGKTDCPKRCTLSRHLQVITGKAKKTIRLSDFQALPIKINYMDTVIHRRSKRNFMSAGPVKK
ncbi:hypothetical protein [Desulfobacula sp.]|uniref:hypothetical protein n=1 Tax=Desulfobacula sp. TaxID=2593537 RepID=UPI00260EA479|nr:hypothetical protein [Desulfobacula sp.]